MNQELINSVMHDMNQYLSNEQMIILIEEIQRICSTYGLDYPEIM